jgi:hypothetical protein
MTDAPHDAAQAPAGPRGRLATAVGVFLVFAVAGPPLAAALAVGIIPFFGRTGQRFMPARLDDFINGMAALVFMAFFFGGLQAVAMGLVASVRQYVSGKPRVSLPLVLFVSLAIAIVVVIVLAQPFSMPAPHPGIVLAVLVLHVGPAVCCGLIANAFLRRREQRHATMVVQ